MIENKIEESEMTVEEKNSLWVDKVGGWAALFSAIGVLYTFYFSGGTAIKYDQVNALRQEAASYAVEEKSFRGLSFKKVTPSSLVAAFGEVGYSPEETFERVSENPFLRETYAVSSMIADGFNPRDADGMVQHGLFAYKQGGHIHISEMSQEAVRSLADVNNDGAISLEEVTEAYRIADIRYIEILPAIKGGFEGNLRSLLTPWVVDKESSLYRYVEMKRESLSE